MAASLLRSLLAAGALMALSAPLLEAHACACCTETGQRNVGSEDFAEFRRAEVERMKFAGDATVFGADREPEEGYAGPVLAGSYTMTAAWQGDRLVFTLTGADGKGGAIALKRPAKIGIFEVDTRQVPKSGGEEGGMGPSLYKEWKLTGAADATGVFATGVNGGTLTLILQGGGNSCPDAIDFKHWTLVMEAPGIAYTLFGDLAAPD